MAVAADFCAINDASHALVAGGSCRRSFEVPPNVHRDGGRSQSVIFVKYFLEGASALTWELHLNGTKLLESSGSGSHLLMTMEAFRPNLLLPGENEVEVKAVRGLGTLRIADMVVQFHVTV